MRTKTAKSRGPGRLSDASTIRNPHARPRRGSRRPAVETNLPPLDDRTAQRAAEPAFMLLPAELLAWDNMARWSVLYRCRYRMGRADQDCRLRDFIAASRAAALEKLRHRMVGFDVAAIELWSVRGPLTRDEVATVHEANEWLAAEQRRAGVVGQGPGRAAAIERWLQAK